MAMPLKGMRALTAADLDALIRGIEEELTTVWAVYGEYDEHLRWRIVKIVPWAERDEGVVAMKLEGAVDALDAYKKVKEQIK